MKDPYIRSSEESRRTGRASISSQADALRAELKQLGVDKLKAEGQMSELAEHLRNGLAHINSSRTPLNERDRKRGDLQESVRVKKFPIKQQLLAIEERMAEVKCRLDMNHGGVSEAPKRKPDLCPQILAALERIEKTLNAIAHKLQ